MKKVKYVGRLRAYLTNGKIYDVMEYSRYNYTYIKICNDNGEVYDYPMSYEAGRTDFIDVTAEYRNDIISSILE